MRLLPTAALALGVSLPAPAHEGHDHGAAEPPADVRVAPRFEARGDAWELVGVLAGSDLLLYVDGALDNAPVEGAQIEIEGLPGRAEPLGEGVYRLPAGAYGQAGRHALTVSLAAAGTGDLLAAELNVPAPAAVAAHAHLGSYLAAALGLVVLAASLLLLRRGRRGRAGGVQRGEDGQ